MNLKSYMYDLVTPYYDHVGFFEFVGDEYLTVLGRSNAVQWACRLGNGDCYNNAKAQFAAWKISPANVEYRKIFKNRAKPLKCGLT